MASLPRKLADSFAIDANPVKREQPLDAPDEARAILDEMLAFPFDPLGILFFNSRYAHLAGNAVVAA